MQQSISQSKPYKPPSGSEKRRLMLKLVLGVVRVRQGASSSSERAAQARERDANGPFIGKGGSSDKKGLFSRLKSSIGLGDVNVGGG
jgi:hypothetical protein